MILFFDTETTGLRPGNVCQLSYVMQTEKKVFAKNFFFSVDFIEPSAAFVNGLSVEKLKVLSGGRRFMDDMEEIGEDFSGADLIVAHNFDFDFCFLRKEFAENGGVFRFKKELCSMKKFTPICALFRSDNVRYKYPKLTELCKFCNLNEEIISEAVNGLFGGGGSFHDARFDTAALYLAMNEAAKFNAEIEEVFKNYL